MSLVIALAASRRAVIGADRRSIAFLGNCQKLEEELYSGRIKTDKEMETRAKEIGAVLQVSDGREKVWWERFPELSSHLGRRRRIYIAPWASLQVEIKREEMAGLKPEDRCGEAKITAWGEVGCTIFGNRFTQRLAAEEIARAGARVDERLIQRILQKAGDMTASVNREYTTLKSDVVKADARADLLAALQKDCEECG